MLSCFDVNVVQIKAFCFLTVFNIYSLLVELEILHFTNVLDTRFCVS